MSKTNIAKVRVTPESRPVDWTIVAQIEQWLFERRISPADPEQLAFEARDRPTAKVSRQGSTPVPHPSDSEADEDEGTPAS